MNDDICLEKHKRIEEKLQVHDTRINNHADRLDRLEQDGREFKTDIRNLCKKMDDFISTIKWGMGIFITVSIFVIGILLKR